MMKLRFYFYSSWMSFACVCMAGMHLCVNTTSRASSLCSGEVWCFRRDARVEQSQMSVLTCIWVGCVCGLRAMALCQLQQPTQWNPMNAASPLLDIAVSIMHGLYWQNQSLLACKVHQSEVMMYDVIQCGRGTYFFLVSHQLTTGLNYKPTHFLHTCP